MINFYKKLPVVYTDKFSEIPEFPEIPRKFSRKFRGIFRVNAVFQRENLSFY